MEALIPMPVQFSGHGNDSLVCFVLCCLQMPASRAFPWEQAGDATPPRLSDVAIYEWIEPLAIQMLVREPADVDTLADQAFLPRFISNEAGRQESYCRCC